MFFFFLSISLSSRHPESSSRPSFQDILFEFSQHTEHKEGDKEGDKEGEEEWEEENLLLCWAEEDQDHHPEITTLGAELEIANNLFQDLQMTYKSSDSWQNQHSCNAVRTVFKS